MNLKGGTRRRGTELEDAILDAAWDVLTQHGYSGLTYEAVAGAASTSRPVLYRRWPRREDLLLATLRRHWTPIPVPDTGNLRDDALGYLRNANAGRARMITLVAVQLTDYFRETGTSFADLRRELRGTDRSTPFATIIARAVERGDVADVPRSATVVDLPFDLLRHDLVVTMQPVAARRLVEIIDEVWLPLVEGSPGTARA